MKKRGQIVIFIIIGIMALLLLLVLFTIKSKKDVVEKEEYLIEEVPLQVQPIAKYVTICLKQTTEQGMAYIGERGGYYNVSEFRDEPDLLSTTESSVFYMFPSIDNPKQGNAVKIPYWFYMDSDNRCSDCYYIMNYPYLKKEEDRASIEGEAEKYVLAKLDYCLNNFDEFKTQGFEIRKKGTTKIKVRVREDKMDAYLVMPLVIKKGTDTFEISEYITDIDLNMKKIYELAEEIVQDQKEYKYLERFTYNVISAYSGTTEDSLPSVSDSTFEFGSVGTMWKRSEVKENVKRLMTQYIQAIQAAGTSNYVFRDYPDDIIKHKFYNSASLITLQRDYSPLELRHTYLPLWDMYFDINCNGELCMPESYSNFLLTLVGTQRYNFMYDVSYPVMITIKDPEAFEGKGYEFRYAMETNLRNNEAIKDTDAENYANIQTASMLCDSNKRNSGNITIVMRDYLTEKPLPGALISYDCGGESCNVGLTDDKGMFKDALPICMGGTLVIFKQGYKLRSSFYSTELDKEGRIEMSMKPLKKINVNVKKRNIVKANDEWMYLSGREYDPDRKEKIIVIVTENLPKWQNPAMQVVEYNVSDDNVSLELAPGKYKVMVQSADYRELEIPTEKREVGEFPFEQEITINGTMFNESNPFPSGGAEAEFDLGDDLYDSEKITFYYISPDLYNIPKDKRVIEDLQMMMQWSNYSNIYKEDVIPKLS